MSTLKPTDILAEREAQRVQITWSDGHVSHFPMAYLRGHCPCAECQGHGGGHVFIEVEGKATELAEMRQVGSYAINFVFADGHDPGFYTYEHLIKICPCEAHGGPGLQA